MGNKEELLQLVKKQIEIEKTNVEKVNKTEEKVGNAAAKLFLHVIGIDSQKHANILKGITDVLTEIQPSEEFWEHKLERYVDPFVIEKELENHIEREAHMIAHVGKEIEQTKDEALKQLLQHILEDEKRHHKMLKTVIRNLHKTKS